MSILNGLEDLVLSKDTTDATTPAPDAAPALGKPKSTAVNVKAAPSNQKATTENNENYSLNLILPGSNAAAAASTTPLTDDEKKKRMLWIMGAGLAALIILIIALSMRKK